MIRAALERLFPNFYAVMREWPVEKWLMLPIALAWLIATVSAPIHSFFLWMGWIHETFIGA